MFLNIFGNGLSLIKPKPSKHNSSLLVFNPIVGKDLPYGTGSSYPRYYIYWRIKINFSFKSFFSRFEEYLQTELSQQSSGLWSQLAPRLRQLLLQDNQLVIELAQIEQYLYGQNSLGNK